jgi:hypothetical protein
VLRSERGPGCLRDLRAREFEEVGKGLRDVEPPIEPRLETRLERIERVRLADRDELRRRLVEPVEKRADDGDREVLELGVGSCFRRLRGDVELVADVAVEAVALLLDGGDRLAREGERDRLVAQEFPAFGVGDDRPLVADNGVAEPCRGQVGADGPEHAARYNDDVDTRVDGGAKGADRARPKLEVLTDQRPIEVAGESLDVGGKLGREANRQGWRRT